MEEEAPVEEHTTTRHRARRLIVDGPTSLGSRARARRWRQLLDTFPDLQNMSVLDMGGTVEFWLRAPVQPRSVHVVNVEDPPDAPLPHWLRADVADVCNPPLGLLDEGGYDIAVSNSVIEHVGGDQQRAAFAQVAARCAPRMWVQTPYRFFPIEPHWVCPFLQFMPLAMRARVAMWWPLVHTRPVDFNEAVESLMATELIDITAMRRYFPDAEIRYERALGLVKSVIAVRLSDLPLLGDTARHRPGQGADPTAGHRDAHRPDHAVSHHPDHSGSHRPDHAAGQSHGQSAGPASEHTGDQHTSAPAGA